MMDTNSEPIIVKYLSQQCIGYSGSTSIFENIGVDRDGQQWRFRTDITTNADGFMRIGEPYGFKRIDETAASASQEGAS